NRVINRPAAPRTQPCRAPENQRPLDAMRGKPLPRLDIFGQNAQRTSIFARHELLVLVGLGHKETLVVATAPENQENCRIIPTARNEAWPETEYTDTNGYAPLRRDPESSQPPHAARRAHNASSRKRNHPLWSRSFRPEGACWLE